MARLNCLPAALATIAALPGSVVADATTCNPRNVTAACAPIPGLTTSTYFMDFTTQTTTPGDWILADYAAVNYAAPDGANFTITKRQQAPYIWSRFYVMFGRIEVVMKVAKGAGIITGAVMMSDDLDEIDWEFSGNNFGRSSGQVLNNYFGKGQIGWSDRGTYPAVDSPQDKYHTYTLDWQSDRLIWSIDGVTVRTLNNNGATSGSYQYPQTPSRLHLGMWDAGDPDSAQGTVNWAGGYTNFTEAPFTAFVKSVKITTGNTCNSWQYPYPFDGTYKSVKCSDQTVTLPCMYTVVGGDDGYKIAKNLTVNVDSLKVANPGVDWDKLMLGQVLNVPGGTCTTSSTTTSMASTTSASASTTVTSSIASSTSSMSSSSSGTTTSSSIPSSSSTIASTNPPSTSSSTSTTSSSAATSSIGTTSAMSSTATSSMTTGSSTVTSATTSTTAYSNTTTPATSMTSTSLNSTPPIVSSSGSSTTTSSVPAQSYTVVAGDFGWAIADKNGCSFDALTAANPGISWDNLQIGQTINVPGPSSGSSAASTTSVSQSTSSASSSTSSNASTPTSGSTTAASSSATGATSTSASTSSISGQTSGSTTSTSVPSSSDTGTSSTGSSSSGSSSTTTSSSSSGASTSATDSISTSATVPASSSGSNTVSSTASTTSSLSAGTSTPTLASSSAATSTSAGSSPATTTPASSTLPSSTNAVNPIIPTGKMFCNQDNCLRNVIDPRYSSSMREFCSKYTTKAPNETPLPTFISGCGADVKRVSSACSCLITSFGPTGTASSHAVTGSAFRSDAPSGRGIPSWLLKRSPLRWNRVGA